MAASILYDCGYLFLLWKGVQNDAHCKLYQTSLRVTLSNTNLWRAALAENDKFFVRHYSICRATQNFFNQYNICIYIRQ